MKNSIKDLSKAITDLAERTKNMNREGVGEYARRYKKYDNLTYREIDTAFKLSK